MGRPVVPDENGRKAKSSGCLLCGRNKLKSTSVKKSKSHNESHSDSIYFTFKTHLLFVFINSAKSIAPVGMDSFASVLMQMIFMSFLLFSIASFTVANVLGVAMMAFASLISN